MQIAGTCTEHVPGYAVCIAVRPQSQPCTNPAEILNGKLHFLYIKISFYYQTANCSMVKMFSLKFVLSPNHLLSSTYNFFLKTCC